MCWLIFPFHLPFRSLNCLNLLPSDVDLVRIGVIGQNRQTSKDLDYQFMPQRFLFHNRNLRNSKFLNLITQVSGQNSYLLEFFNVQFSNISSTRRTFFFFFWEQILGYNRYKNKITEKAFNVKQISLLKWHQNLSLDLLFSGLLCRCQKI